MGTQYDSEESYGNTTRSAASSEDYYSVSEDKFGFRIPQLRAMRITEESDPEQRSQGTFARLRRSILHRRRRPSETATSSDGTISDSAPEGGDISESMPSLHSVQSSDTEITEDEGGKMSDTLPSLVSILDVEIDHSDEETERRTTPRPTDMNSEGLGFLQRGRWRR